MMFKWLGLFVGLTVLVSGCATPNYTVGMPGPSGGYIFYDDEADGEDNLPGDRFLEAAPADLEGEYSWGVPEEAVPDLEDGYSLGSGEAASTAISDYYVDGGFAANACANYTAGKTDDWFLPSRDELRLMYTVLKKNGQGNFTDGRYLSSGEDDPTGVEAIVFEDGAFDCITKDTPCLVRPVRAFSLDE